MGAFSGFASGLSGALMDPLKQRAKEKKKKTTGGATAAKAADSPLNTNPSGAEAYAKGGRVKRTGMAKVHAGEYIVPRKVVRKRQMKQPIFKQF